jgi:hypothetical protein
MRTFVWKGENIMIELKRNNWQKFTDNVYRSFVLAEPKSIVHQQMPTFQIEFFLQQAIKKNKAVTIWLKGQNQQEYAATGKIKASRQQPQKFLLINQNLNPVLVASQKIKFLELA